MEVNRQREKEKARGERGRDLNKYIWEKIMECHKVHRVSAVRQRKSPETILIEHLLFNWAKEVITLNFNSIEKSSCLTIQKKKRKMCILLSFKWPYKIYILKAWLYSEKGSQCQDRWQKNCEKETVQQGNVHTSLSFCVTWIPEWLRLIISVNRGRLWRTTAQLTLTLSFFSFFLLCF